MPGLADSFFKQVNEQSSRDPLKLTVPSLITELLIEFFGGNYEWWLVHENAVIHNNAANTKG